MGSITKSGFEDVRSLIFEGFIRDRVRVEGNIIVLRTLSPEDESEIFESFEGIDDSQNMLLVVETLKRSIYSVNGCLIPKDSPARKMVTDWSRSIMMQLFELYLRLTQRVRESIQHLEEFIESDESRLRWSSLKNSKSELGKDRSHNYLQQVWIYMNEQHDLNETHKIDWKNIEYMTDTICTFINPTAMKKISQMKENEAAQEPALIEEAPKTDAAPVEAKVEPKPEIKPAEPVIAPVAKKIENTAEQLFGALKRRKDETKDQHEARVAQAVQKSMAEDEFDKAVRDHDEWLFAQRLRIQKELTRRRKLGLLDKREGRDLVIVGGPVPDPRDVAMEYTSVVDSEDSFDKPVDRGPFYVNDVDYTDICETKAFEALVNRDKILKDVANESDEITGDWIKRYIEIENAQLGKVPKPQENEKVEKKMSSEERRQAMLREHNVQDDGLDEIHIGG